MRLPMDPTPPTSYPDSVDSSPRSRGGDSWDEPPPSAAKLRLMCSYGGRIVPRPHDKSLCYVGGDTRIVVADRRSSLSDLSSKLSKTLLHGRAFTLKYQLPNEDLDSLISVATDEDLDNMIDEYDRTLASSPFKPSRLRLFLFPTKPDSASSAPPSLLDVSAKSSDSWFVDALNSSASLPRGLSSTSVDSLLLGLDGGGGGGGGGFAAAPSSASVEADLKQTASDSPMVMETGSSFGSASSGPSLSNLPPVRVRSDGVDDRSPPAAAQVGVEEYFAQMGLQRAEDHPPPPPPLMVVGGAPASVSPVENPNRVSSDDERSADHGVSRKAIPPQPIAPPPQQQKLGNLDLPSPDSSINGPGFYQDQVTSVVSKERTSPAATAAPIHTIPDPRREVRSDPYLIPTQLQDPNYGLPIQPEKQQPPPPLPQFVHTGHPHYMPHHATGHIPMASYYQPIHPQHQQQQQQQQQQFEQSTYPVYYVPYNLAMPPNLGEIPPTQATMASIRNLTTRLGQSHLSLKWVQISTELLLQQQPLLNHHHQQVK
ncbi:hypothetical protein QJS10_CPA01g01580 [Acorus calamus]|uniref:PB1 domain-containing protein n=1 Tax=Acorus calamus TaxID=4465 RepID=A0AAV9FLU3_ACOCL|nr:hypothetical protein QJS10_CPA01g01580 [Acorus calamus]